MLDVRRFGVHYKSRIGKRDDGCLTAYNIERFGLEKKYELEFFAKDDELLCV